MARSTLPPAAVLTLAVWLHDGQLVARIHTADPASEADRTMPSAVAGRGAIAHHVEGWLERVERTRRERDAI